MGYTKKESGSHRANDMSSVYHRPTSRDASTFHVPDARRMRSDPDGTAGAGRKEGNREDRKRTGPAASSGHRS